MWLLLGCSIVAVGVFLERLFLFHRSTINVGEFLQGLSNLIRKKLLKLWFVLSLQGQLPEDAFSSYTP